jgi:hypothetical protein
MSDKGAKKTSNAIKKSLSKCLNILLILLNPLKPLFVQFPVPLLSISPLHLGQSLIHIIL